MPLAPLHPCQPGCPVLLPMGVPRCAKHEKARHTRDRQRRGSAHQRGYTSRWRAHRARFLAEHPLCAPCERVGRTTPATVVDHIRAHKGDEDLFWDEENHQASCKPCHDARTDEGDFGREAR